jgi:hypothetical protein
MVMGRRREPTGMGALDGGVRGANGVWCGTRAGETARGAGRGVVRTLQSPGSGSKAHCGRPGRPHVAR